MVVGFLEGVFFWSQVATKCVQLLCMYMPQACRELLFPNRFLGGVQRYWAYQELQHAADDMCRVMYVQ